jgi:indolepyruvate decarboxylase
MRSRMKLGDFLVAYLQRAGVTHIFGLPGDLVLGLFLRFGRTRGLEVVTFSHEPAVGFAADGYARSTRKLGVVCVTYGAGGHNIVNPVAGAYAEQIPLLVVSGGPGEAEQKIAGVHHQVKDVEAQCRIFSEVTCTARILRHPDTAAEEVHETLRAILLEHRPGYLEIHRDMVDVAISVPKHIVEWDGSFPRPVSDKRKLAEAVAETTARLRSAKRPILIGGVELCAPSATSCGWRRRSRPRWSPPSSRRACFRWTTRSTWGSTSAPSAHRRSRSGCATRTWSSRWAISSPT